MSNFLYLNLGNFLKSRQFLGDCLTEIYITLTHMAMGISMDCVGMGMLHKKQGWSPVLPH